MGSGDVYKRQRVTRAAIETHTPITDYLAMPILQFGDLWNTICDVVNERNGHKE